MGGGQATSGRGLCASAEFPPPDGSGDALRLRVGVSALRVGPTELAEAFVSATNPFRREYWQPLPPRPGPGMGELTAGLQRMQLPQQAQAEAVRVPGESETAAPGPGSQRPPRSPRARPKSTQPGETSLGAGGAPALAQGRFSRGMSDAERVALDFGCDLTERLSTRSRVSLASECLGQDMSRLEALNGFNLSASPGGSSLASAASTPPPSSGGPVGLLQSACEGVGGGGSAAGERSPTQSPGGGGGMRRVSSLQQLSHVRAPSFGGEGGILDLEEIPALTERRRLAVIMMGLPARGKTFTAMKLQRYLNWLGYQTRHFNAGAYRRRFQGGFPSRESIREIFGENDQGKAFREEMALMALEDMLEWMRTEKGQVGIFDATNTTADRRDSILKRLKGHCKVLFVESVCTDPGTLRQNILLKAHKSSDYEGVPEEEAVADFTRRIADYEARYNTLGEEDKRNQTAYVKLINTATDSGSFVANRLRGFLPTRVGYFLMNAHPVPRKVYLCRHGRSVYNTENRIGGDSGLTTEGRRFSKALANWVRALPEDERPAVVWTSTLRRTVSTAQYLGNYPQVQFKLLDEIDAGRCDGMTYEEIAEQMPEEFEARQADKLHYQYPGGESYMDVIQRLEPVITELERQRVPILIVAHQAILRALTAYLKGQPLREIPHLPMPLHTLLALTPHSYGCHEERQPLLPAARAAA